MLIIDEKPNLEDRSKFNARAAAIHGFSIFGRDHTYLLNPDGEIDYDLLNNFLRNFSGKKFLFLDLQVMYLKIYLKN